MIEKELELKLDGIMSKISSIEERLGVLEEKISSLMNWRAVQDRMWKERDKMNGHTDSAISSIEGKLGELRDSIIKLQACYDQSDKESSKYSRRINTYLALFAGIMMLGTLVVQIVMTTR